MITQWLYKVTI